MPDAMSEKNQSPSLISPASRVNLIILCSGFLLFCILMLIDYLTGISGMVAGSLILAYLLLGPVHFIEDRLPALRIPAHLHRTISIILVYLLFLGMIAVAVIRVAPTLTLQIREFAHEVPSYISQMEESPADGVSKSQRLSEMMQRGLEDDTSTATTKQSRIAAATSEMALRKLIGIYQRYASRAGSLLLDVGTSTLSGLVYGLTTLVLVFILLHDGAGLKRGFVNLMPSHLETPVAEFLERLHVQFYRFVKGQVLMSLISGSLVYLLLYLLDIKYALLLGLSFGLVSILPVIGPWLGLIPITFILAFSNHLTYILQVLLFAGIFYLVKTYWLWPKLVDRRFNIHPIIFILTFLACLKLVGYLGILLSFPLASLLGVWFDMLRARQVKERRKLTVEA
ncbi:MAG TPA: AI-2E family transporter [Coleofasciculaceae cyanobacterium]|jgi:predicted PurR-regulated permease PerM